MSTVCSDTGLQRQTKEWEKLEGGVGGAELLIHGLRVVMVAYRLFVGVFLSDLHPLINQLLIDVKTATHKVRRPFRPFFRVSNSRIIRG